MRYIKIPPCLNHWLIWCVHSSQYQITGGEGPKQVKSAEKWPVWEIFTTRVTSPGQVSLIQICSFKVISTSHTVSASGHGKHLTWEPFRLTKETEKGRWGFAAPETTDSYWQLSTKLGLSLHPPTWQQDARHRWYSFPLSWGYGCCWAVLVTSLCSYTWSGFSHWVSQGFDSCRHKKTACGRTRIKLWNMTVSWPCGVSCKLLDSSGKAKV